MRPRFTSPNDDRSTKRVVRSVDEQHQTARNVHSHAPLNFRRVVLCSQSGALRRKQCFQVCTWFHDVRCTSLSLRTASRKQLCASCTVNSTVVRTLQQKQFARGRIIHRLRRRRFFFEAVKLPTPPSQPKLEVLTRESSSPAPEAAAAAAESLGPSACGAPRRHEEAPMAQSLSSRSLSVSWKPTVDVDAGLTRPPGVASPQRWEGGSSDNARLKGNICVQAALGG